MNKSLRISCLVSELKKLIDYDKLNYAEKGIIFLEIDLFVDKEKIGFVTGSLFNIDAIEDSDGVADRKLEEFCEGILIKELKEYGQYEEALLYYNGDLQALINDSSEELWRICGDYSDKFIFPIDRFEEEILDNLTSFKIEPLFDLLKQFSIILALTKTELNSEYEYIILEALCVIRNTIGELISQDLLLMEGDTFSYKYEDEKALKKVLTPIVKEI